MDGLLVVDKPSGPTSHDIVRTIRKITGIKKVGHAGTLDPSATGVLIILIGRATKLASRFLSDDKAYSGVIRFGQTTDTLDAEGKTVEERSAESLTLNDVEKASLKFQGEMEQTPPMVSAIKVNGVPLYKAARRGETIDVPPRAITINKFEITGWSPGLYPEAFFTIECSKGTYVRSIARDLGEAVGCGAHLASLKRTRSGAFKLADALTMPELLRDGLNAISRHLIPLETL
jgi:tRNA pseudouridine55 synthase